MSGRYDREYIARDNSSSIMLPPPTPSRHALTSFMQYGTFDRFPRLKIVLLEVGRRMDQLLAGPHGRVYNSYRRPHALPLKEKPSFYFKRNIWISADPDEHALPAMVELCGAGQVLLGLRFPASGPYRQLYRRT